MKKDSIVKNALILFAITLIAGMLLGVTQNVTAEARSQQDTIKTNNALAAVLPSDSFNSLEFDGEEYPMITAIYEGVNADGSLNGYAFQLGTTEGYGALIKLMVAVNVDGTINGIDVISHSETPGLGAKADEDGFKSQFVGKLAETIEVVKGGGASGQQIDAIGGATITSRAVTGAANEAISYFNNELGGAQ